MNETERDEIEVDELARWLIDNCLAEEKRGYGHPDGEEVAMKLLASFEILRRDD